MLTPSATPAPLRTARLVVLLLLRVALLNYLDRQMLAATKYSVMDDIPTTVTDCQLGADARAIQMGLRLSQSGRRLRRGPLLPARHHLR